MRGTTDTSTPSSWQRWIEPAHARVGDRGERHDQVAHAACAARSRRRPRRVPSTGTSQSPTSASERGSSSRKPTGHSPYSGWCSRRCATCEPTSPAPTISTGRPISRRPRAHRWPSARRPRPAPTATSASSHAAHPLRLVGELPVDEQPDHRDGHRRHRHRADDGHERCRGRARAAASGRARAGRAAASRAPAARAAARSPRGRVHGVRRRRAPRHGATHSSEQVHGRHAGRPSPAPRAATAAARAAPRTPRGAPARRAACLDRQRQGRRGRLPGDAGRFRRVERRGLVGAPAVCAGPPRRRHSWRARRESHGSHRRQGQRERHGGRRQRVGAGEPRPGPRCGRGGSQGARAARALAGGGAAAGAGRARAGGFDTRPRPCHGSPPCRRRPTRSRSPRRRPGRSPSRHRRWSRRPRRRRPAPRARRR